MKIEELYQHANLLSNTRGSGAAAATETGDQAGVERQEAQKTGTRVDLSTASMEVRRISEMMDVEDPQRVEKVNRIRAQVASGEYQTDAKRVADSIVKTALLDFLES
jgi:flagellar biosynthesis anti-sigma factor FlgM